MNFNLLKNIKIMMAGLLTTGYSSSFLINKFLDKKINLKSPKKFSNNYDEISNWDKSYERINIFDNFSFSTQLFNKSIIYLSKNNEQRRSYLINEEELKIALKRLITQSLEKLFYREGWNINELWGEIHYKISNNQSSIEVLVLLKKSIYVKKFTHYDWFEITLKKEGERLYF